MNLGVPNLRRGNVEPASVSTSGMLAIGLFLGKFNQDARMSASIKKAKVSAVETNKSLSTKHSVQTASGRISYTEQGTSPVALFVHGVLLNGHL